MLKELEDSKILIDRAIDEYTQMVTRRLDGTEKYDPSLKELMDHLFDIEDQYKEYCAELDIDYTTEGEETIYESDTGISIEFYLEADQWHHVSKLLRRLR